MRWLDPAECRTAQDCLDQGNPLEAAGILLHSPQRDHRAVQLVRLEVNRVLVGHAAAAYAQQELNAALELIRCARQCADLSPDAVALEHQIAGDLAEVKRKGQWNEERFRQVEQLAGHGRLPSAIELAASLDGGAEAGRLCRDLEQRMAKFRRYLTECQQRPSPHRSLCLCPRRFGGDCTTRHRKGSQVPAAKTR